MTSRVSTKNELRQQLEVNIQLNEHLIANINLLVQIAEVIENAYSEGHKVLIIGNGGSAADAQHIAGELVGKYYLHRPPLPAIALTANSCVITAVGNDYKYEDVFVRQIQALTRPGDVVLGISTSGKSQNIIEALKEARNLGAVTISFTGLDGQLKDFSDYILEIPSKDTPRIQEAYMTAGHIICYLVEKTLFGKS